MIAIVKLSEILPHFVHAVNTGDYETANKIFKQMKSLLSLLKAQIGRSENYKKIDDIMKELETCIRHRMKRSEALQQELLYAFADMGIPVR